MRQFGLARLRLWWERAFWVIPVLGVALGIALHDVVSALDEYIAASVRVPSMVSASSASQLLAAIGSGMVTFVGFVFSFVVLILQFGSSQYSPRTVSYFLQAKSTRNILAIFLATIAFTFVSLLDVGSLGRADFTPSVTVAMAVVLLFVSLGAFIALLHSVGGRVRVDAVLTAMGRRACRQLPKRLPAPAGADLAVDEPDAPAGGGRLVRAHRSGQTVAIDPHHLVRIAQRHGLRVVLLIQVGDSVTVGSPLMRVEAGDKEVGAGVLRGLARAVVVDQERSLRYDPFYSLRLLVDIAIRALSPGINDPTTAVRALDEIEGVLRVAAPLALGTRRLRAGGAEVVVRSPGWGDVVALGLVEIMLCGSGQPQVTRRLTALIDDLVADLPEDRDAPLVELRRELEIRVAGQDFSPRLAAIAQRGDRQGLGGTLGGAR
jgi:uncharacterized membrane protein